MNSGVSVAMKYAEKMIWRIVAISYCVLFVVTVLLRKSLVSVLFTWYLIPAFLISLGVLIGLTRRWERFFWAVPLAFGALHLILNLALKGFDFWSFVTPANLRDWFWDGVHPALIGIAGGWLLRFVFDRLKKG